MPVANGLVGFAGWDLMIVRSNLASGNPGEVADLYRVSFRFSWEIKGLYGLGDMSSSQELDPSIYAHMDSSLRCIDSRL